MMEIGKTYRFSHADGEAPRNWEYVGPFDVRNNAEVGFDIGHEFVCRDPAQRAWMRVANLNPEWLKT